MNDEVEITKNDPNRDNGGKDICTMFSGVRNITRKNYIVF